MAAAHDERAREWRPPAAIRSTDSLAQNVRDRRELLAMRLLLGFIESAFLLWCEFTKLSRPLIQGQLTDSVHPARFVYTEAGHSEDLQKNKTKE